MMDIRPVELILMTSLIGEKIAFMVSKERALSKLREAYPVDFGYDAEAWLSYALENDPVFFKKLHGMFGDEIYLDMDKRLLLTEEGWIELHQMVGHVHSYDGWD